MRQLMMTTCVLFATAASAAADPVFELGISGPDEISGTPGLTVQIPLIVELRTTPDALFPELGAAAWSLSIGAEVARIVGASVQGTAGATTADIPPGLRNPASGFEETSLTSGPDNEGAVSTVVLDVADDAVLLPPTGRSRLLALTLEGTVPAAGVTDTWRVFTTDGLSVPGPDPVNNIITWRNNALIPIGAELSVQVIGISSLTGDTNNDGQVNIDDLNNVRNNFGASGPPDGSLDGDAVPHDGMVDIDDLNAVRNNFGAGAAPVPEPATAWLALMGMMAIACRRSRFRGRSEFFAGLSN